MADAPDVKKKSGGRWLRVVLFASLAINLLIVGMVAGAVLRGGPWNKGRPGGPPPYFELGNGPVGRALSRDSRREIGRELVDRSGDLRANRDVVRAQYVALLQALRTEPFDAALVNNIISEQQENLLRRQDIGKKLLVRHVANMTVVERTEYAERLERFLRHGKGRK